jgi:hypothetical protein
VYIEGEGYGAAANNYGYYSISSVPQGGPYTLIVSAIGYGQITREIRCAEGEALRLDFELTEEMIPGGEVVVEAKRIGGMQDPHVGHAVVPQAAFRHSPALIEPDLFRTLHMLPGVNSISDFSSGLYIWGGSPSDNLILLDNIEVYNPTHLMGIMSTFITDAVRNVNLIKGGYPARWGGRLGSVLEVTNKDGNRKSFQGMTELSLLSGKLLLEGPVAEGSYMIAGRRSWIDVALKAIDEEELPYYFYDLQGRVNQDLSPKDKASLSVYGGDDVLSFDDDDDDDFEYRWGNLTVSAQWTHIFSEKVFGHMVLAGSRFRTKLDVDVDDIELEDAINDVSLKADLSYFHSDRHSVKFGGMLKWREFHNYYRLVEDDSETPPDSTEDSIYKWDKNINASLIALYGEEEYRPSAFWRFQGGLRAEFAANGDYFRIGPRFSLQRHIDDLTTLRGAYGRYYQYIHLINPLEEVGIAVFDSWIPVNETITPASAHNFVLGMDTDYLPLHLSANVYYKTMNHLIELRDEEDIIDDDQGDFHSRFYEGSGRAAGLDLSLERWSERVKFFLGYGLGWTMRTMGDENDGINNGDPYYPKYDRRHSVKLSLTLSPGRRLTFSTAFNYSTGQPVTEPVSFEKYVDDGRIYYRPVWGDEYHNGRLPNYQRLDVALHWTAHDGNWRLVPYLQVMNVLNHENVIIREWDDVMEDEIEPDDEGWLPLVPTLGFRAEF